MRWRVALATSWLAACGTRDASSQSDASDTRADTDTGTCAVEVTASLGHTCIRKADSSIWCWGRNYAGEAADDPALNEICVSGGIRYGCLKTPHKALMPVPATGVAAGGGHNCVLAGPMTYCFGGNGQGQFGNGADGYSSHVPQEIVQRMGSMQIAASWSATCSIINGDAMCSGPNNNGEVGSGDQMPVYLPFRTQQGVQKIAMGFVDTCSVSNNAVWCWGNNYYHQIDSSSITPIPTPTLVAGAPAAVDVAVGQDHVCATDLAGGVSCWGRNMYGQLGIGTTSAMETPTALSITNVVQIVAGVRHTCARRASGDVQCWGEWFNSQLNLLPTTIALPLPATSIAAGDDHDCAVLADGSVWCWGWNAYGQFGNGTQSDVPSSAAVKSSVCP